MLLATRPSVPIAVAMRSKSDAHLWRLGQPIANRRRATSFRLRAGRADILAVEAVMPRAKSQIGNRGGRRKGAAENKLTLSDRRKIASDSQLEKIREELGPMSFSRRRRREDIIHELMAKYGVTYRMVVRCLLNSWKTSTTKKCGGTQRRGTDTAASGRKKIKKLKPGIYTDEKLSLRLIVNSAGNRKWFFVSAVIPKSL